MLLYDPRLAHNDSYVSKLVADVFSANAKHPFPIVDTLDNVIIEVGFKARATRFPGLMARLPAYQEVLSSYGRQMALQGRPWAPPYF